jgi:hypothetical protein
VYLLRQENGGGAEVRPCYIGLYLGAPFGVLLSWEQELEQVECKQEHWVCFDPDGRYSVSGWGRVRNNRTGRILKPSYDRQGYVKVKIYDRQGNRIANRVNVLVAMWHIRPRRHGEEVDHINGRRDNNHVSNLRWVTHKQNVRYGIQRREEESGQKWLLQEDV